MARHHLSGRYSICGLGVTPVGRVTGNSLLWNEVEAARLAIEDAGLERKDIGAALQALSDPGGGMRMRHDDAFPRVLGLPVKIYCENVGRGGEYAAMANPTRSGVPPSCWARGPITGRRAKLSMNERKTAP